MSVRNRRIRGAVPLGVVMLAASTLLVGCEAENPVVIEGPGQASVVLRIDRADKVMGDFNLEFTLHVYPEEGQEVPTDLQRVIPIHGGVAQGPLEVPAQHMVGLEARAAIDGTNYVGSVTPSSVRLAQGAADTLDVFLIPQQR